MILIRHGESEFNVHFNRTRIDPGIRDPAPRTDRQITSLSNRSSAASSREKSIFSDRSAPHAVFVFSAFMSAFGMTC